MGNIDPGLLIERIANLIALRFEESIRHAAADQDCISNAEQALQDLDLVGDLGPANDSYKRTPGIFQCRAQEVDFFLYQETCSAGQIVCHPFSRSMSAVSSAECIIDVDLAKGGKLTSKLRIILLFFLMEAQVFQQQDLTGL